MSGDIDFEFVDRIRNNNRKKILIAIYLSPQHYSDLVELTNLKPGSIYHHLKVLEPLIQKMDKGVYEITPMGAKLVESLGLVKASEIKPRINTSSTVETESITNLENNTATINEIDTGPIIDPSLIKTIVDDVDEEKEHIVDQLWLGKLNIILAIITLSVTVLLSIYGVSLSGSAIYSTHTLSLTVTFDLLGFTLGWLILYLSEYLFSKYPTYNQLKFTLNIRLLSMLPGVIVGLALFLLFINGIVPSEVIYPWIISITTILGLLIMVNGIYYLRGKDIFHSVLLAASVTISDVLIGLVVLLSGI